MLTWSTDSRRSCPVAARRAPSVAWCSVLLSHSPAVPKKYCRWSHSLSHAVSISLSRLTIIFFFSFFLSFLFYFSSIFSSFFVSLYLSDHLFFLFFLFFWLILFLFLCQIEICSKYSLKSQQQDETLKQVRG